VAENSWPFYGQETNETQFSKWARTFAASGIASGLAITAGSGMTISLGAGEALVRGVFYENTEERTVTVEAAPGSGTRRDAIILRLDQTANAITCVVKTGTTSALPELQQDESVWELLIGEVAVPAGAVSVTTAMISERRPSVGAKVYTYATDAVRPTPEDAIALGVNTGAKRVDLWVGGSWVNLSHLDNMSGVLPISKGGTGAQNALAALNALGIFPQASQPPLSGVGQVRIWFKTV
jgi:hypothetical protein